MKIMGKHVNKSLDGQWFHDALIRAIRTAAQVALSGFTIGKAIRDVDWINIASVAIVAALYSFLTSIVTGLPESSTDGTLYIADADDLTKMVFQVESEPDDWSKKSSIRLKVDTSGKLPEGIVVNPNE